MTDAASPDRSRPAAAAASLVEALRIDAAETDRDGAFPVASIEMLRAAGLLAAPLPQALGGLGLGEGARTSELLELLAHIGRGNLAVGRIYEGHVNALQLIERFGSAAQRERWAADACGGKLFGVWNTEAGDGVKLAAAQAGGWAMAGSKTFATGTGHVARALVTGALEGAGWQMAIVPTDESRPREDRSFWKPLGMRATASFRADFSGLRLAGDALLGQPGDYYREPHFSGGAIRFAAVQQGGIEAIFDETRRFLGALGREGDPYQRVRLGEMALLVEGGRLWLQGAAMHASPPAVGDACDAEHAGRVVAYAHMMRSSIEANALRVMQLAERSVGARGLLRPEPFERLHRDLTHYLRQPAPDAALAEAGRHVMARPDPAADLWR